jgi:hypothetical protein
MRYPNEQMRRINQASSGQAMRDLDGYEPAFDDLSGRRWWQYAVAVLLAAGLVYAGLLAFGPPGGGIVMNGREWANAAAVATQDQAIEDIKKDAIEEHERAKDNEGRQ